MFAARHLSAPWTLCPSTTAPDTGRGSGETLDVTLVEPKLVVEAASTSPATPPAAADVLALSALQNFSPSGAPLWPQTNQPVAWAPHDRQREGSEQPGCREPPAKGSQHRPCSLAYVEVSCVRNWLDLGGLSSINA